MKLNDAIAALVKAPAGSTISRPGGPTVRMSVGAAEQVVHRYVIDVDGVGPMAFDASEEDLWKGPVDDAGKRDARDDWKLSTPAKAASKPEDTAKASPQARR